MLLLLLLMLLLLLLLPPPNTTTLPISPHHSTALHRSSSSANRHASTGANCSKTPQRLHVQHASNFPQQKNTGANATANTSHTPAAATSSLHPSRSSTGLRALQNCLQGPPSSRISTVPVEIQRHAEYGFGVVFWWLFNTMKGSLWQHLYIDSMTFCIPLSFSSSHARCKSREQSLMS